MPAFDKYNSKYHDDWGWSLAIKGCTNEEIATAFGISKRTLIRWMNQYESLKNAINEGKASADAKVERKLYERALGYEVEEEQKVLNVSKEGGSRIGRITITKKHVPPDPTSCIFWLKNRHPDIWRDVQRMEHGGKVEVSHDPQIERLIEDPEAQRLLAELHARATSGHVEGAGEA